MPNEREGFELAESANPSEDIDRHTKRIVRRIETTTNEITTLLNGVDIDNLTHAEQQKIVREVNRLLDELDRDIPAEVETSVNDIYEHGRARVLVSLGMFANIGAAIRYLRSKLSKESRTHRQYKRSQVEITVEDLLAATQNTRRRVKSEVRRVAAEVLRTGEGVASQRRDIRNRLKDAGIFAIRDSANRRWTIDRYADVVVRTKLAQAHREATEIEAEEQGAEYVVVSRHGEACPKCIPWEGRLLRISDKGDQSIPTLDEAMASGLFHPGCSHNVTVTRNIDILPGWVKR